MVVVAKVVGFCFISWHRTLSAGRERERERRPDSVATISLIDISVCSARLLGRGGKFGVLGEEIKRRSSFSPVRL